MFAALFASYAVLVHATAGGPTGAQLFNQRSGRDRNRLPSRLELHLRIDVPGRSARDATSRHLSGCPDHLRARSRVPRARDPRVRRHDRHRRDVRSAALFFPPSSRLSAATGCTSPLGLIWLVVMMAQVAVKGFRASVRAPPALLLPVLARARHRLGLAVHGGLSDGSRFHDRHAIRSRARRQRRALPDMEAWDVRPACSSTRSDWFWRWSSRPRRSGSPTHRCSGQAASALGLDCPRHRPDGHSPGVFPARHHAGRTTPTT